MGGAPSKENTQDERLLRHTAESLKTCLKDHRSCVHALESAISAQKDATEILLPMLSEGKQQQRVDLSDQIVRVGYVLPYLTTDGAFHAIRQYKTNEKRVCQRQVCFSAMPKMGECDSGLGNQPLEKAQSLLSNIQKTLSHECTSLNASYNVLQNFICEKLQPFIPESGALMDMEDPKSGCSSKDSTLTYEMERQNDFDISNINDPHHRQGGANNFGQSENRNSQKEKDELIKIQDENKKQKLELSQLTQLIKEKTKTIKDLEKQKNDLESDKRRIAKDNEKNIADLAKRLRHSEEEKKRLQNTVHTRECRIAELENEKRKMREKRISVPVQLFYQRKDDLMTAVVEELSAMLNTQMNTKNIQLDIIRCENTSMIQQDKPILVLCINASRLGTDAAASIEGIQRSARTALLIFHHKNVHALPNHPSDRMLTSQEFKSLGGIFDLAFLSGRGIYTCDMNNIAVSGIENFIRQNITN